MVRNMIYIKNLSSLDIDESGMIKVLYAKGTMRRRLQDVGFITGTKVSCVQESPSGDPRAYLVRGAVIAIRNSDAKNIVVESCEKGNL